MRTVGGSIAAEQLTNPAKSQAPVAGEDRTGRREEVIAALFVAHSRSLVSLARLLTDDQGTAEEVVQEAFLSLHRHWLRIRAPESALPYLQRSVVNGSRTVLRHRRILRSVHVPASPDEPPADGPALDHEETSTLRRFLAELPRRQRQVLVLRYYLDQNEKQIAQALGISAGSVKQHASRGIETLNIRLRGEPR
jgi:RNA polymerase sigma-70 factor (sigma-E family)